MGKQDSIATLDLHGFKVDEVFDAVEKFLRIHEGKAAKRVRILHGKGTGKVKEEVLKYLKQANYPSQPERMESGKINEGSLLVFLD
jgi:dsDNA-specific endonuclease/ATPase MutS2